MISYILLGIISLLIAIGRFTIKGRPMSEFSWDLTYEAFAHIWVGSLIMALFIKKARIPALVFLLLLIAVEIILAVQVPR